MTDVNNLAITTHSAWLSTAASQIFFMELGFLCLEGGYVQPEYIQSLIIKNIEDIFFGFTTYAVFGYAIVTYNYEYIALYNLPYSEWDTVFVNAAFAATAATIMSGAILERMKNIAYSLWVFVIILVNYSLISRWIWGKDGWLFQLGFIDCAGCSAVHMVGGIGGLILCYCLGPRYSSLQHVNDPMDQHTKTLKEKHAPRQLLIMIMGTLILWYGWVAFNTSSPIIADVGIGGNVGVAGLLTVILPSCSTVSTYAVTYLQWPNWRMLTNKGIKPGTPIIERSSENLSIAVLSGLVVVTACCYTINLILAIIIGLLIPFPIFWVSYYLRSKWKIDDPLDVVAIHLFGGIIGLLVEGLCNLDHGLLTTGRYKHFGVQCLGIAVTLISNVVLDVMWWLMFKHILFRNTDIKTTPLSICLSTSRHNVFIMDYGLAFKELMFGDTNFSRSLLIKFRRYLMNIYCDEQLDFLLAVYQYRQLLERKTTLTSMLPHNAGRTPVIIQTQMKRTTSSRTTSANTTSITKSVIAITTNSVINDLYTITNKQINNSFTSICNLYILNDSRKQINISSAVKKQIIIRYNEINKLKKVKKEYSELSTKQEKDIVVDIDNGVGHKEEKEKDDLIDTIIDKTVFNKAFMETLKLTQHNLKVFLQKNHGDPSLQVERKTHGMIYRVCSDTYNVEWFHEQNNNIQMSTIKPSIKKRSNSWIASHDGTFKSVEEEICDILSI